MIKMCAKFNEDAVGLVSIIMFTMQKCDGTTEASIYALRREKKVAYFWWKPLMEFGRDKNAGDSQQL